MQKKAEKSQAKKNSFTPQVLQTLLIESQGGGYNINLHIFFSQPWRGKEFGFLWQMEKHLRTPPECILQSSVKK